MTTAAVAIGSNIDPEANVPQALDLIDELDRVTVVATSTVYRTEAVGPDGAKDGNPTFHNSVALLDTDLGPLALRAGLRGIERQMGRQRGTDRYAPRPIDLDIVFYGTVAVTTDEVEIPAADALTTPHVVVPLADVAPEWRPPGGSITAREAAASHELTRV